MIFCRVFDKIFRLFQALGQCRRSQKRRGARSRTSLVPCPLFEPSPFSLSSIVSTYRERPIFLLYHIPLVPCRFFDRPRANTNVHPEDWCEFMCTHTRPTFLFSTEVRCADETEIRLNHSLLSFEPTVAVPRSRP